MSQPGYNAASDNCVDRVEDALDAGGISHPSFDTLGVSNPTNLNNWISNGAPPASTIGTGDIY